MEVASRRDKDSPRVGKVCAVELRSAPMRMDETDANWRHEARDPDPGIFPGFVMLYDDLLFAIDHTKSR